MALVYSYGDPRYGIGFNLRSTGEDSGGAKTINYVNLKVGEETTGYTPAQISSFISLIATATGKTATGMKMTAERPINATEE